MNYRQSVIKRKIEALIIFPIVMLGKMLYRLYPYKGEFDVVMFCPSADIGGANKVNAEICKCFHEKKIWVIFSKKPKNNQFLSLYDLPNVTILDLYKKTDRKVFHFINIFYRGVLASWIHKNKIPVMIGGESIYFYKVLPYLSQEIKCVDLTHVDKWFAYTQAFIKDIHQRIYSTVTLYKEAGKFYQLHGVASRFLPRLMYIDNKVAIPGYQENENDVLQVIFIGRGSPQKRVHLIAAIARKINEKKLPVHFSIVGDVSKVIDPKQLPFCTFYGNISDAGKMANIYQSADVLLLTSAFEGLPLAVMEMMAYGKVVVSTAVSGIPDYIAHGMNGFLITDHQDENRLIKQGVEIIKKLCDDRILLRETGLHAREFAMKHFDEKIFCEKWKEVVEG